MVSIKNVSVSFTSKNAVMHAVKNVSLKVRDGEIYGIVGTSGAGKSTLIRTVNMLQRPTSGTIYIGDTNITALSGDELRATRQKIGMIFQHFNLIHTKTVYDNVALPMLIAKKDKKVIESRVPELLSLVGLSDKAASYPLQLSGGQKQRVGIARALANDPDLLLCDEPTSALDLETTRSILELIRDINRRFGITMIIISHEMDVIKSVCTRVAVMKDGEVVDSDSAYGIFSRPGHDVTKELIKYSLNLDVPENIRKSIAGIMVKVIYLKDTALDPVLSDVIKKFPVKTNIIHGKIEYIGGQPIGIFILNFKGKKNDIASALEYLRKRTASVEVI